LLALALKVGLPSFLPPSFFPIPPFPPSSLFRLGTTTTLLLQLQFGNGAMEGI
jgi:hypothetical protein